MLTNHPSVLGGGGGGSGDVTKAGNNAFTGVNNFAYVPSSAWVSLAAGTALTNGVPYYDALSVDRTLTFTTAAPNGTSISNTALVRFTVTNTPTLTFPASIRNGSASAAPITSLVLSAGIYTFSWQYENGAWYLTDSVPSVAAIAYGGTGQATASLAFDALSGAETTVASATTTDLGAVTSNKVSITGTTTITGFGTVAAGVERSGVFTGSLTLTQNSSSLILPGGANITTQAGDTFRAVSLGSGNWRVYSYTPATGKSVVSGGRIIQFTAAAATLSAGNNWYFATAAGPVSSNQGRYLVPIPSTGTITKIQVCYHSGVGGDNLHSLTVDVWINNATAVGGITIVSNLTDSYPVAVVSQAVTEWNGTTGDKAEIRVNAPAGMTSTAASTFTILVTIE